MEITREDLGQRQVMLTIRVDEERVEKALRGAARRISKDVNIPGFRRGRAPYSVIVQRFGRKALLNEVVDDLGQHAYAEALEQEGLEPYEAGTLEDLQLDPLTFKMRVSLQPRVDLGDYRALRVEPPEVSVDEEEVQAELTRLQNEYAYLEPADDRPAQIGDLVTLDVIATLEDETLVDQRDVDVTLDAEDDPFEAGFAEQIVGMQVDEDKEFPLTLSDEWGEDLEGQAAQFQVTLHEIKRRVLPELDDDLARTIGDYDTLEELRQEIKERKREAAQAQAYQAHVEEALEALVDQAEVEYPPELVEEQLDGMLDDFEKRLESQGLSFEDFLKLRDQTEEMYRESLYPQAERIAERGLVLSELVRQEQLEVERDEIDERITAMSAAWGEQAANMREALSSPQGLRTVLNDLLTDKAIERLVTIAKGEAPPLEEVEEVTEKEAQTREDLEETAEVGQAPAAAETESSPEIEEAS